jgi:hypothetical protein
MNLKALRADPLGYLIIRASRHGLLNWLPDRMYLKLRYRAYLKKVPPSPRPDHRLQREVGYPYASS